MKQQFIQPYSYWKEILNCDFRRRIRNRRNIPTSPCWNKHCFFVHHSILIENKCREVFLCQSGDITTNFRQKYWEVAMLWAIWNSCLIYVAATNIAATWSELNCMKVILGFSVGRYFKMKIIYEEIQEGCWSSMNIGSSHDVFRMFLQNPSPFWRVLANGQIGPFCYVFASKPLEDWVRDLWNLTSARLPCFLAKENVG